MLLKKWKFLSFSRAPSSAFNENEMLRKTINSIAFLLVGAITILLAYRQLIFNSFAELPGDRYDMVIMSAILEHWHNVWSGSSVWHNVGYFYPYSRTIAQTDGYFLTGFIYSLVRLFVNDIFISVAFTMIVLSCIGYISMFYLIRRVLLFRFETSLLMSCVFVLLSSLVGHNQRLQLMSVYFLPMLTCFLINYLHAVSLREKAFSKTMIGCFFGLFYGALTITCFYIAWFYALFLMVVFLVFSIFKPNLVFTWLKNFISLKSSSFLVVIVFLSSLMPFVWAYYPKSLEVGVRLYSSVSVNLIAPMELIQVGYDNYLYGGLLRRVFQLFYPGYQPWSEYYNVGFSPLIFGLFIVSFFSFIKGKEIGSNILYLLVATSTLISCFLVVKFSGFSPWYYIYSFIPGAKALNAVSVFLMVLSLPVLVVVGKYIDSQKFSMSFMLVFSALLIVGELTKPYIHFDRKIEESRISNIPNPPATCRVFYVSAYDKQMTVPGFPEWVNSMYAHNVTAMIIAQVIKLPTLNGVASFNPPDWNFAAPWDNGYDARIFRYANKHGIENLCKFDLNTKTWSKIDNSSLQ